MKKCRFLFGLLFVCCCGCHHEGITINVKNKYPITVTNITLLYSGGQKQIQFLPFDATYKTVIRPTSESSIQMSYWMNNNISKTNIDVYFEPGYRGEVLIEIEPDGRVTKVSKIHL